VTGNSEQGEQSVERARRIEEARAREWGMPLFRAAREFVAGDRATQEGIGPVLEVARKVAEAMDLGTDEVIAIIQKYGGFPSWRDAAILSGEGTLTAGGNITAGANLTGVGRLVAGADVTVSESESVVKLEDINELSTRASREGIAGLSPAQILTLVLVWLLMLGAPVVQELALPPDAQTVVSNEYATLSIGLAITVMILQNRKR
jgi:hypothetical protein